MLRRSLQFFSLAALLGLAVTVAYAVFRLRGPADLLREATTEHAAGRHAQAVWILDQCERSASVRQDPGLERQLLRLRYAANLELANYLRALRDLQALLAAGETPDETMQQDHIRLLALQGQGEAALTLARTFLTTHPNHGRALELAGEACQVAYGDSLRETTAAVRRDVGPEAAAAATTALLGWLYRPEGDPGAAAGLEHLRGLYAGQVQSAQRWEPLQKTLEELRRRIQEGLDYHRRSLEAGGQPVAAFLGMAFALEQAGRTDDLVAFCETYRRRFDHVWVTSAVGTAAAAHLRDGLPEAAADVVRRWLPPGQAAAMLQQERLDATAAPVLTTAAFALWRRRDQKGLDALGKEIRALAAAGLQLALPNHCVGAFIGLLKNDDRGAEANLRAATEILRRQAAPRSGADPLAELMPLRLGLMQKRGAKDDEILAVFDGWLKARDAEQEPRFARIRYLLTAGKAAAAFASAVDAQERNPQEEAALRMLATAASANFAAAGQDGPGLVRQCAQRRNPLPEVPHPVCYLLCAEEALARKLAVLARTNAKAAIDKFPWARWPRQLEAQALLLAREEAEAQAALQRLLSTWPTDTEALSIWLQVRQRAGAPIDQHLFAALRSLPFDPTLAEALLRRALDDDRLMALAFGERIEQVAASPPLLTALAARALAAGKEATRARALLTRAASHGAPTPELRQEFALAELELLRAEAGTLADGALVAAAHAMLSRQPFVGFAAASELSAVATALAATRPATAQVLLTAAMTAQDAEQVRTAANWLLAAALARRLGQLRLAEEHLFAALSFQDGDAAVEPLVRLLLLRGQEERALQVWRLGSDWRDPALALRCGNAQLGQRLAVANAAAWPGDGLAATLVALATNVAAGSAGSELRSGDERQTHAVLELVALLHEPDLAGPALTAAAKLAALRPDSPTAQLLLARAQLGMGLLDAARTTHGQLLASGWQPNLVLGDIARAAHARADYRLTPEAEKALRAAVFTGQLSDPIAQVVAGRGLAIEAAAAGSATVATQLFAQVWLRHPLVSGARPADAQNLFQLGEADSALQLLAALLPGLSGSDRREAIDSYFAVASAVLKLRPGLTPQLRQQATAIVDADDAPGAALHFLLALPDDKAPLAPATVREWLRRQLVRCATGRDRWTLGHDSIRALRERFGPIETLAVLDHVLQDHPTALPAWIARAQLLADSGRAADGLADLRHLLGYVADPGLTLATVTMAAENRALLDTDDALLAALPAATLATPAGTHARALVALRRGRAKEAAEALATCPPGADGSALWFQAMAELARGDRRDDKVVVGLLQRLARDYASSSRARYAGSLARQLASN
ncbi:MAG: hypothetical protein IPK26_15765 [Planctomycetes bacterium]|nr:hypothetical protein [Planctomycetota bacterium]